MEREIMKQELFSKVKVQINFLKFTGYESRMGIYIFESEFLKLHSRTTPKRMIPDVIKNKLLESTALSLVKSIDDIE